MKDDAAGAALDLEGRRRTGWQGLEQQWLLPDCARVPPVGYETMRAKDDFTQPSGSRVNDSGGFVAPDDLIATALAPAVAMSTGAILATSLQGRFSSIVDRIRELASERRQLRTLVALSEPEGARLARIERQLPLMVARGRWVQASVVFFYGGIAAFLACTLALAFAARGVPGAWRAAAEVCFLVGLSGLLAGVVTEILEMRLAFRVVRVEVGGEVATTTRAA